MPGILETYRSFFNFAPDFKIVSLQEGNTPLIPAEKIARHTGIDGLKVYLKYDGANPTGSFKDRGMTYAVSQAKARGAERIICASTGNTSAAAAAYGALAGIKTIILLPQGKVALGKLSQAVLYGADIIEIEGNFDQALDLVRVLGTNPDIEIVNSINPYRIQGQKTGAFEVCDQLGGRAPDYHFIPVGNAGNITAYWLGYQEYLQAGLISQTPKMMGYEAEGSAAIVYNHVITHPETLATAIRIGNPASWTGATSARDESGGQIDFVTDADIITAYKMLAREEGVFCEPASAASVAGLLKASALGHVLPGSTVVCVLTGSGLKDPDNAIAYGQAQKQCVAATPEAVLNALK
jgi:threonine synthase